MPQSMSRRGAPEATADFDLAILESSNVVAAIVVAADGAIVGANARMRRFLGLSDELGGRLVEHLPEPSAWEVWRDVPSAGRSVEVELRGFDGATQRFRGELFAQGEGARQRTLGIFVDGDDNEVLRAAAQRSARMEALGSLTAGVAHDFNNLLTVLVGNLYLIGEELREQPRVFAKLKAARDAGKRGAELIKQLMTFARREEIAVGTVDPKQVIDELLPLLRRALGVRIKLETMLQPNAGSIRASVAQLESVVVNLAVNARDAIEGKGRIAIEVAVVDVSDYEAAAPPARARRALCRRQRARYRQRYSAGNHRARFRAVLFDQGRTRRHRARPQHGALVRRKLRWLGGHRERRRAGHDGNAVAASGAGRATERTRPSTRRCRYRCCRRARSASSCSHSTKLCARRFTRLSECSVTAW